LLRSRQTEGIVLDCDGPDCTPLPDLDRLATPAQAAELREERLAVWRAALGLPPEQRLALALREMHGMSYARIAESMGKSIAAVETLLFRARVGFRRAFALPAVACQRSGQRLQAGVSDVPMPTPVSFRQEILVTDEYAYRLYEFGKSILLLG
jgi:hypothetical protein